MTDTPAVKVGVRSSCGHSWTETRPAGLALPQDGELRVCGAFEHYPAQYPVTYSEPVEVDTTGRAAMRMAAEEGLPLRDPTR